MVKIYPNLLKFNTKLKKNLARQRPGVLGRRRWPGGGAVTVGGGGNARRGEGSDGGLGQRQKTVTRLRHCGAGARGGSRRGYEFLNFVKVHHKFIG
jgi:hypothetical protein